MIKTTIIINKIALNRERPLDGWISAFVLTFLESMVTMRNGKALCIILDLALVLLLIT